MGLIRFLLASMVVLFHTSSIFGYHPMTGNVAVQCFYIISGFYMTLILNEKYTGRKSNTLFYTNRALKIYPIYFTVLIMLIVWSVFVFKKGYPGTLSFYSSYWPLPVSTLLYLVFVNVF